MKKFAIFCGAIVALVALWGLWYIGGNAREDGRQWCASNSSGLVFCNSTLSACEDATRDVRDGRCVKVLTSTLFYCRREQSVYGRYQPPSISCFLTRSECSYTSSSTCELMTYEQAKALDSNHIL